MSAIKEKSRLLIVGAFPPKDSQIYGGIVTICKTLLDSEFPEQFDLVLVDSTQRSNPPPGFFQRLIFATIRFGEYIDKLFTRSPDAVLLFTAIGASVVEKGLMARFARLKRIPVFLFPRGAELIDIVNKSALQKMWAKPAMRGATYFLCQGPAWQRFAVSVLGFSVERAAIIHNWSATPELLRIGAERENLLIDVIPHIIFIGWFEKEKGVFELLEACQTLSQKHRFILTIAGRGRAEKDAREFVKNNSLESHVRFAGWVKDVTKLDLLRTADILVLPSWAEGFPNVIIEAMAAKLSVIVTRVGNIPDLLSDRQQALLIPAKNAGAIVTALEELLIDRMFRLGLAERGYEYAKKTFSTEAGVSRLAVLINEAVESSKASRCAE